MSELQTLPNAAYDLASPEPTPIPGTEATPPYRDLPPDGVDRFSDLSTPPGLGGTDRFADISGSPVSPTPTPTPVPSGSVGLDRFADIATPEAPETAKSFAIAMAAPEIFLPRMGTMGTDTNLLHLDTSNPPQWLSNATSAAGETVQGFVPKSAEDVAGMLTPIVPSYQQGKEIYSTIKDWVNGEPIDQAIIKNDATRAMFAAADSSPPLSKERFRAAFTTLAQLGMLYAGGKALTPKPRGPFNAIPKPSTTSEVLRTGQARENVPSDTGRVEPINPQGTPPGAGPPETAPTEAIPPATQTAPTAPITANDLRPALKTDSGIIEGKKGQEHAQVITDNPQAVADTTNFGEENHGFVNVNDPKNFISRAQGQEALGLDKPLTSQTLIELQKASQPATEGGGIQTGAPQGAPGFTVAFSEDQRLGIVPQPSKFVKLDVARAVRSAFKGIRQIRGLFNAANASPEAGVTARIIRENAAQLARDYEIASTALKKAAKVLRKNTPAQNLSLIDDFENGVKSLNPDIAAYQKARQAAYDSRIAQVRAVNPNAMQELIDNYFPHIWTKESIAKVAGNIDKLSVDNPWARVFGKRPLEGSKAFLKQRKIPTTEEGIAIGLEPVTTNPVALDLLKMHEMDRYVMGQRIMQEMKERGLAKFVATGDRPDPGYIKINDRIAEVNAPLNWKVVDGAGNPMPGRVALGHYYAPEDAARVINNHLSPGLHGFAPYDAFRFLGNTMNQVQLGLSLYHATFTAIDAATSTVALGLEQIGRSGGSPKEILRGTGNIVRGLVEAPVGGALVENLWRGNKFLREYSRPGTSNAELAKIVDAAIAGGARAKMGSFYKTGAINSFFDAIHTGNYTGATLRAPFALFEAAAKPLMEYVVPRLKAGIILQNLADELRRLPPEATRDDVRKIAARTVDSVDNRMGQMIYDNLFWHKALKDTLMASVRSVGWNVGDIREIGGGALDTITAPKRAVNVLRGKAGIADNPIVTKRMTYAVALPMLVGALGSMYQYLMTGEGPQDLRDVYMPRTGKINPDGTPERVMLPTYMKDIAPLAVAAMDQGVVGLTRRLYRMAINKLHPALTTISQMLNNQDYYGNQIRNADDDLVTTIEKEAKFAIGNFRPFSVQGIQRREGGIKEKGQAVIGIMPAPRELTDTPAMRMIREINLTNRPAGGYTSEQQARRQFRRESAVSGIDRRGLMFKSLSKEERARVLEVATPEETALFLNAIQPQPKVKSSQLKAVKLKEVKLK